MPACRAFRRDSLNTHQIRFDEGRRVWEDRPFVLQYLYFCRNIYSIDACLYNYILTSNSLSQRYSLEYFKIIIEISISIELSTKTNLILIPRSSITTGVSRWKA